MKNNGWTLTLTVGMLLFGCVRRRPEAPLTGLYPIEVDRITGERIRLDEYRGKVLLIVNTASKCGFTKQYDGLQALYETYGDRGLVVLGFPSNDFLNQEPGAADEIAVFCRLNHGVLFPLFAKIAVSGSHQHPLYAWLTSKETNPEFGGRISWNFNKFLIGRDGAVVARFGSRTTPEDPEVKAAIETALEPEK